MYDSSILCPNCNGTGKETHYDLGLTVYPLKTIKTKECECSVCNGKGRVIQVITYQTLED